MSALLWLLAFTLPMNGYGAESELIDPRTLTFEAVQFLPPEPERVVFENGLVVYLLEDHELPLITITATFRTGSWLDPPDKVGLAALTGTVMRTGGGGALSAAEVDDELAHFGGRLAIAIGRQSGSASLDVLNNNFLRGLEIFGGLLRSPTFDPAEVDLAKLQAIERIRRREDEPESIASREFAKLLYGSSHPSARESSIESIERINREDLIAFHHDTIHPNGIILGVTGDFARDEMVASLLKTFGDWKRGPVPEVKIADVPKDEAERAVIHFVNKDTSQTHLRVGHLSIKENDSDYVALAIANDILGGDSGVSRLFNEVRTKRGLAYSVGSELRTSMFDQGMWLLWAETNLPSTTDVLGEMVANVERISSELVSDEELAASKEGYMNASIFDSSSASKIVSRLVQLEYDGLPRDFFLQLREKVLHVSKHDVLAAAKKYLRLDRLKIMAVGSGGALSKLLSTFPSVPSPGEEDGQRMANRTADHACLGEQVAFAPSMIVPSFVEVGRKCGRASVARK
ncbi:MAG TPA: pitrilysin family protein [Nitrospira sp.]|nr:pitrilysin family protein [Nitrospira sp.]